MKLKQIIEQNDTPAGRIFDLFIQSLIVLSLVSFSLETLRGMSAAALKLLKAFEVFCIAVFTVEYLLRVVVANPKRRFIFSFYGLIDIAAILPFYFASGLDLRSLRSFRLLRLFRAFKLLRYNRAIHRFSRAFTIAKEELVLFGITALLLIYFSAVGIYFFEKKAQPEAFASVFDGLWWAVVTLTTVGYGDVYPVTVGGRIFAFFLILLGLIVVAVPTGLISSALSKARAEEEQDKVGGS